MARVSATAHALEFLERLPADAKYSAHGRKDGPGAHAQSCSANETEAAPKCAPWETGIAKTGGHPHRYAGAGRGVEVEMQRLQLQLEGAA